MCGICGFVSKREISLDKLKEMNDTMYHRGPDDSGEEIYEISKLSLYSPKSLHSLSMLLISSIYFSFTRLLKFP